MGIEYNLLIDSMYFTELLNSNTTDTTINFLHKNICNCYVTPITLGELYALLASGNKVYFHQKLQSLTKYCKEYLKILKYSNDVSKLYGGIFKETRKPPKYKSQTRGNDAWQLAFARLYGLKIVTRNKGHFPDTDLFDLENFSYTPSTSSLF
jgi:predicted nucleic acid-binding protein